MVNNDNNNMENHIEVILNGQLSERRMVSFLEECKIFASNKAFAAYLGQEDMGDRDFLQYVYPQEAEQFKHFIKKALENEAEAVFKIMNAEGEYKSNLVRKVSKKKSDDWIINSSFEFIDIEDSVALYDKTLESIDKLRVALSLTNEYVYIYNKVTNIITIYKYDQYQRIELFNMDVDEWKMFLLEKNYVLSDEKAMLDSLILGFNMYLQRFSVNLNTSIRTDGETMEHVKFLGSIYNTIEEGRIVIGRIVLDEEISHANTIMNLMDELQTDSLTGVYNKKTITEYAKKRIAEEKENRVIIAILDVDHFKSVNDTFGHMYGDTVLARVGRKLKEVVGEQGVVGRMGGDEFMIIFTGLNDEQLLRGMLRAIRTQIKWEFAEDFESLSVTCSIGASIFPTNGTEYEDLFRKADCCLYIAKEKGRDRYVFFRDELHRTSYESTVNKNELSAFKNTREIRELQYVTKFMTGAVTNPQLALKDAFVHIFNAFGVDNISIFYGEQMEKIYSYGQDLPAFNKISYIKHPEFKNLLVSEENYIEFGFLRKVEERAPEIAKYMEGFDICASIQCFLGTFENINGMVTFNKSTSEAQWANYEINCAVIVSSFLSRMSVEGTLFKIIDFSKLEI